MKSVDKIDVLGINLDRVDYESASKRVEGFLEAYDNNVIVTPNAEIIMTAQKNSELAKALNNADLCLPDGIGVVLASKILGKPLVERTTGYDFMIKILSMANERSLSVFLLGGKPGIAKKAAENVKKTYEDIKIAGVHHGYFQQSDEEEVITKINNSSPDILLVAMGAPRQELFMMKNIKKLKFRVAMGVGGSLDVLSGTVSRAPVFMQRTGLEWLYRLIAQPSRYKRMGTLPVFLIEILAHRFSRKN